MSDLRFLYPVEYDAGWQLGRYGSKPEVRFGAYIDPSPEAPAARARYSAFCEGEGDGTRARWAAGGATERERKLLERVHAAQSARGIVPLPMPPR